MKTNLQILVQRLGLRLPPQSKIVVRIASLFFGALALASTAQAKLNVVATTPDLASIAREIGGDKIELTTLAKATEDPHFVDAKPISSSAPPSMSTSARFSFTMKLGLATTVRSMPAMCFVVSANACHRR